MAADTQQMFPGHIPTPPVPPAPDAAAEQEVEFAPGQDETFVGGEAPDYDQKPDAEGDKAEQPKAEEPTPDDILDSIVPKKEPKTWVIGPEHLQRTFVQKELSFIGKMQWFSLVGGVLDKALSGPTGMSLNSLFSTPARGGALSLEDFKDADMFVQAIGKLLSAAPDFLVDSYLIWLNVPDYDREIMRDIMKLPPDEGGLSDDQGMEIIEIFLDQNYDSLASFFGDRLGQLQARVSKLSKDRASQRSKR